MAVCQNGSPPGTFTVTSRATAARRKSASPTKCATIVSRADRQAFPDLEIDSGGEDLEKSVGHVLYLVLEPRRGSHLQQPLVGPRIAPPLPGPQLHHQHLWNGLAGRLGWLGGPRELQVPAKLLPDFLATPEDSDDVGASEDFADERNPAVGGETQARSSGFSCSTTASPAYGPIALRAAQAGGNNG